MFERDLENRKIKHNIQTTEIFILQQKLENTSIIEIIQCLTFKYQVPINNISIACIISSKNTLNMLAYKYAKLKIYTTEII